MAKKEPWTTRCMYVSEKGAKCETVTPRQWSHCVRFGIGRARVQAATHARQPDRNGSNRFPLGGFR